MEIHQLEYVVALEKYRHFSKAAAEISVSQSTLSDQIKKLENELGIRLFLRSTRKVELTPAGETFIISAKRILDEIQNARNAIYEHSHLLTGKIKIGTNSNASYHGVTAVIAEFMKKYPGIAVELIEANSDSLIKKLNNSEIDLAFLSSPHIRGHETNFHTLFEDRLVLFISKSHPLAKRKSVTLSELSQEKFLMIKATTGWRNDITDACRHAGFEPNIILESNFTETIRGFIEEGLGVTLFTYHIAVSVKSPRTAIVNIVNPIKSMTGLAVPKNTDSVLTKAFRDFVLTCRMFGK